MIIKVIYHMINYDLQLYNKYKSLNTYYSNNSNAVDNIIV